MATFKLGFCGMRDLPSVTTAGITTFKVCPIRMHSRVSREYNAVFATHKFPALVPKMDGGRTH